MLAGAAAQCEEALIRGGELRQGTGELRYNTTSLVDQVDIAWAWSFHNLGRHVEAAAIPQVQIPLITASDLRARTRFGLRRALAHTAAGDVDQACGPRAAVSRTRSASCSPQWRCSPSSASSPPASTVGVGELAEFAG
ncbi:hypothetical protein JNUCC0626_47410 [Lentzea sp. JNUCC 0626]|uniref:hypothetical protein n=1 Tax=Lentzea sp. JNUCC 0626 TaxID=3367513 RepID=UPI003747C0B8